MGTRADFYIRENNEMIWLGSKAWDGYPEGIDKNILNSTIEDEYKSLTVEWLKSKNDATLPEDGWPWPWDDSRTTDYSYIFENGKVMASCFGYALFDPVKGEDNEDEEESEKMNDYFPDMSEVKNVQMGSKKSGVILMTINTDGSVEAK